MQLKINEYNNVKLEIEENKTKIEKALYENIEALTYAECVTKNLSGINLGGNKTVDSMNNCKNEINMRKKFYENELQKATNAITQVENAIEQAKQIRDSIPINCGTCSECCPPTEEKNKI